MKLGYSLTTRNPKNVPASEVADSILERARTARSAGFDYVQIGDHHAVSDAYYFQNIPTLARLTEVFDHVGAMFLLPLYRNPILLAEYIGVIASFSERFDMWCGLGYIQDEFDAFDVPISERVPRFEECLEIVKRLLRDDEVSFQGEYYAFEDVSINPKSEPRFCIGGSAKPAIERAATQGDAWIIPPYIQPDEIDEKIPVHADAGGEKRILRRDALALEDGSKAKQIVKDLLRSDYRGWSLEDEGRIIAGDVSDVRQQLAEFQDRGVSEVVIRPMDEEYISDTVTVFSDARDQL